MSVGERFGENLVILRRHADLSQERLAARASLHRTEIGELERGVRLPRIDTLIKLAGALGLGPEQLLKGIVWRPSEPGVGGFQTESSRRDPGS